LLYHFVSIFVKTNQLHQIITACHISFLFHETSKTIVAITQAINISISGQEMYFNTSPGCFSISAQVCSDSEVCALSPCSPFFVPNNASLCSFMAFLKKSISPSQKFQREDDHACKAMKSF
jgi:hypothetical protein